MAALKHRINVECFRAFAFFKNYDFMATQFLLKLAVLGSGLPLKNDQ